MPTGSCTGRWVELEGFREPGTISCGAEPQGLPNTMDGAVLLFPGQLNGGGAHIFLFNYRATPRNPHINY